MQQNKIDHPTTATPCREELRVYVIQSPEMPMANDNPDYLTCYDFVIVCRPNTDDWYSAVLSWLVLLFPELSRRDRREVLDYANRWTIQKGDDLCVEVCRHETGGSMIKVLGGAVPSTPGILTLTWDELEMRLGNANAVILDEIQDIMLEL